MCVALWYVLTTSLPLFGAADIHWSRAFLLSFSRNLWSPSAQRLGHLFASPKKDRLPVRAVTGRQKCYSKYLATRTERPCPVTTFSGHSCGTQARRSWVLSSDSSPGVKASLSIAPGRTVPVRASSHQIHGKTVSGQTETMLIPVSQLESNSLLKHHPGSNTARNPHENLGSPWFNMNYSSVSY